MSDCAHINATTLAGSSTTVAVARVGPVIRLDPGAAGRGARPVGPAAVELTMAQAAQLRNALSELLAPAVVPARKEQAS